MVDFRTLFDGVEKREVTGGDRLVQVDHPVRYVFLVISGHISLERPLADGSVAVFQVAKAGDVLAEASVYSDRYHCEARALVTSSVAALPRESFCALVHTPDMAADWAAHLARSVQNSRLRAEIRSLKTVRARLDAWLAAYGDLPKPGQLQQVAAEIAVSREALYRELSRRRGTRA